MTDRKSINANLLRALGPLFIALGVLLLSPAVAVGVWLSRQGTIGFDPFSRNVGITITAFGLVSVVTGIHLTMRQRKAPITDEGKAIPRTRLFVDMMIEVIQSKGIGNYETEAAAEVIAADARFNIWFAENMKRKPEKVERCLEILDAGEALLAECAEAVDAFAAGGQREVLRINLWKIRDQLDELRE